MQNKIEAHRQQIYVAPQDFAHPTLDAIAFGSLAQHLAGGEPDSRAGRRFGLWSKKPAHGSRLALAACRIDALIVGMAPQACTCQCEPARERNRLCLMRASRWEIAHVAVPEGGRIGNTPNTSPA